MKALEKNSNRLLSSHLTSASLFEWIYKENRNLINMRTSNLIIWKKSNCMVT